VETRVVEGDTGRCNLLEVPDGEGRRGIAGATDAGFPKFVLVVVVSVLSGGLNRCKGRMARIEH